MLKLLVICLCAVAISKWGQKVQAEDDVNDLNDEEKRLLQALKETLDEGKRNVDTDPCDDVCLDDNECYEECLTCYETCMDTIDNEEDCVIYCTTNDEGEKRMVDGQENQAQSKLNTKMTKKGWIPSPRIPIPRIPTPRIPIPRIPTPRIPIPRIPRPRIPIPRIPIPRIPTPRIPRIPRPRIPTPRVRWWRG